MDYHYRLFAFRIEYHHLQNLTGMVRIWIQHHCPRTKHQDNRAEYRMDGNLVDFYCFGICHTFPWSVGHSVVPCSKSSFDK